jgi:Spy/CpxP family protein refolding chaperone
MHRLRFLATSAVLACAVMAAAQPPQTSSSAAAPGLEQHMTMLTEKLSLTSDQQAQLRPILGDMLAARERIFQDESMSPDERADIAKAEFYKADRKVRLTLTDDQKKKLDEFEQQMHHGTHGD